MSIVHTKETNEQQQQGQREEVAKTMEYIDRRCHRCVMCDSLIDVTGTQVIKITCPMCKSAWCLLCRQKWNVHGAHSGGLQV